MILLAFLLITIRLLIGVQYLQLPDKISSKTKTNSKLKETQY